MPFFQKKPVIIEARFLHPEGDYDEAASIVGWAGGVANDDGFLVPTLEGEHQVRPGMWVIKGVKGEFYGCQADIFEETYQALNYN